MSSLDVTDRVGVWTIAVLGTGSMGTRHLRVAREIPGVGVIAVPTRAERQRELATGGYDTAVSLAEAARRGATLCIVATDTERHGADTLAAFDCGFDVLVEKPLALDAPGAAALCDAAAGVRRRLFVGCVLRFAESLGRFRALLPAIAPIHSVRIACQSYLPDWRPQRGYHESYSARSGGGVLRDLIHEIDYAGWLFGWPAAVQAVVLNTGQLSITAEETAELLWTADGSRSVSVGVDYLTRPTRRRMLACGAGGTLEWDGVDGAVTVALAGDSLRRIETPDTRDRMVRDEIEAFVRSARGTPDPRLATGEEGARALAVCDAARRAAETHCAATVEYR
jgi:predicted dehydrogenase